MGGGKGGRSTSTVTIPPEVLARYNSVNAQAQQVAQRPFQQYGGQFVAPLTPTQQQGIVNTTAAANQAQPYYGAATGQLTSAQSAYQPYQQAATQQTISGLAGAQPYQQAATGLTLGAANPVNAQDLNIGKYMSPYLSTVLGSTASLLNQNNQQQQAGQLGSAIRSGAFGGDRAGIAAANLEQQQNLANANIYSGIANQGFNTALGAAQQQQGVQLSADQANRAALLAASGSLQGLGQQGFAQQLGAAQQIAGLGQQGYNVGANTATTLAGLGAGAQAAALQGAQAQMAAGQTEQQTQQAQNTALYNQFLQQQSYPFQVAQFLANIAEGTGSLSGSTTTTNTVQNGIFSDKRLKTDIKPIGKTFDGQTIYSYRYKGDEHTEIGLMAQEVEKKYPEAVGVAGGYKTVHYGKATDDAADRGHFAYGGAVGLGGGGYDPAMMAQLMANYQAMYGPLLSHEGGVGGAGGIVPQGNLPVQQLHPAEANVPMGPGMADTAKGWASAANAFEGLGKKVGLWKKGSTSDDDTSADDGMASGGVIPYDQGASSGLDIPDDEKRYKLLTPNSQDGVGGGNGIKDTADTLGSLASAGTAIAKFLPFLSDKRAKEDIKAVGKTFDGQTVYSYRYKGDDTPRMGLIAQEVEKHHPDAVGVARGLKTVDYKRATDKAAERGHFAAGGSPMANALREAITPYGRNTLLPDIGTEDDGDKPDDMGADFVESHQAKSDDKSATTPPAVVSDKTRDAAAPAAGSLGHIASLIEKAEGTAKNPKSSAVGPFQILNATLRANASVDPELAKTISGMSGSELTAYRQAHPELAQTYQAIGRKITQDNYNALDSAGITPTAGNVYLAHFLGAAGAKKVLNADPSTPVDKLISADAIKANPTVLAGKTAADVAKWAEQRMSSMETKRAAGGRAAGGRAGYDDGGDVADVPALTDDEKKKQDHTAFDAAFSDMKTPDTSAPAPQDAPTAAPVAPIAKAPDVSAALTAAQGARQQPATETGVPPYMQQPTHRGFFKGLAHGDASSIIPLLSGIGALATTPTNNVFTAIAAGLGAGAQAAQGQNEYRLMQQHTLNETANVGANVAQHRAAALRELEGAYGDAIGNSDKLRALAVNVKAYIQNHVLEPEDLQRFPQLLHYTLGDIGMPLLGGTPGLGVSAPQVPALAIPNAAPAGGVAPAVAPAAASPTQAPQSLADQMPNLLKPTPALAAPKPGPVTTPFDNPTNPGDGLFKNFYQNDSMYQTGRNLVSQATATLEKLNTNPVFRNSDYGAMQAKQAADMMEQGKAYIADAEGRAQSQVGPNAAQIRDVAAANRNFVSGPYQHIINATQSVAHALQNQEINTKTPEIAALIGNFASLGAPVPDFLRNLQGASDIGALNKAYLGLAAIGQAGNSAKAQSTEINVLNNNGIVHSGPHAAYDMAVKLRALADQNKAYAEAFNAAAPTMTNEPKFTTDWYNANSLEKFLHDTVQNTPFAKGMTKDEIAAYLPKVETKRDLRTSFQNGDKYIVYHGVPSVIVRTKNGASVIPFGGGQ